MSFLPHKRNQEKPWGSFEEFTLNESSTVKIIRVAPGMRFSLQTHQHRSEFWCVVEGSGVATVGEEEHPVIVGDELEIPANTPHRLQGGENGIAVLEISIGDFDENDIMRLADDFGRA